MTETATNIEDFPDRIAELFVNKTLLLTGGTGFIGKIFIEKLLRVCPDVRKVYILVRTKKDKNPEDRLREIFKGPLFDLLKEKRGEDVLQKVEAVPGNMEAADLGLAPQDRKKLAEEVEMIYHCAATVRLDEPLKKFVLLNVRGTKLMLELAKECKKLIVFAHVSTAYCHIEERVLYEKPYPPPTDPHAVIKTCEYLDEETLNTITPKILGHCPNGYCFSKALSEGLVNDEMDNLPIIILRPSIIIPVWKEPIPGWADNINGPIGLLIGAGKGVIRTLYCKNENSYLDYVPVDIVVNSMLAVTAGYIETKRRIFNVTSSFQFKVSFEEIIEIGRKLVETEIPLNGILWYPGGTLKRWKWHHNLDFVLFQWIPAVFLDGLLFLLGYKPLLMRVQKRVRKGYEILGFYLNNQWDFNNEESLKALQMMNPKERIIYKLDGDDVDYYDYFRNCIYGARRYILNEADSTIPAAKRHMKIMWFADRLCKVLFFLGLLYFLYKYLEF